MIAELFRSICQIIRIHADAMTADKTGLESKRVPFGVHAGKNLICIDLQLIANDCNLIHERNVDIALAVLNNLDSFRRLNAGNRERASFDNDIIHLLNLSAKLIKPFGLHVQHRFFTIVRHVGLPS